MKKHFIALLMLAILTLNSCASILNGRYQKVEVVTKNPKAEVYVDGTKAGKGSRVTYKMKRDFNAKQVKIVTEGYKDQYVVHFQKKKSPLYIMSWVPFALLYFPPFMDYGEKSLNYDKECVVREKKIKIIDRKDDEKFLFVNKTSLDLGKNKLSTGSLKYKHYLKGRKTKSKYVEYNDEEIGIDNSIFTSSLNEILLNYKYTDTTNTIYKSNVNSLYVNANINGVDLRKVYFSKSKFRAFIGVSEVNIEWEITDIYRQPIYKKSYKGQSGEFIYDREKLTENTIIPSIKDAISASFLTFINNAKVRKLLKKGKKEEVRQEYITINKGTGISNISEAISSTVTIKTAKGHGSGFAISKDGYIVTNFHVVANNGGELDVITHDGKELKAKLVRQNLELDLALLKVEGTFNKHFILPLVDNYSVGDDIFAIGTPRSIELGQTLSKGIVSSERVKGDVKYIQTDASVNSGNSGGPLVRKNGELIGVVNAKFSGLGVEGIGFAIPGEKIIEGLSIKLQ